jgi:hypothetical protein
MDRGIPTEATLREMREPGRDMFYLVGTPKGRIFLFFGLVCDGWTCGSMLIDPTGLARER